MNPELETLPEDDDNLGNRIELADDGSDPAQAIRDQSTHPYQVLTPEIVIEAVESTGRFSDARILALNSYENRVYQVGVEDDQPVIAKFYRPQRWSSEQIDEEHRFTRLLFDLEIPVVPPLVISPDSLTPTLSETHGLLFAIYPRQGGRAPHLDDLDHLEQLGRFLGQIHAAGRNFPLKYRLPLDPRRFGHQSVAFLLENRFIPLDLRPAYEAVTTEILDEISRNNPDSTQYERITLHGDCHPGNILWREDRPHFVDFDDVMSGPAIQDIWMLLSGDLSERQKQLEAILEGYQTFMPFDPAELRLIEPLRAMRMLHYSAWLARRWGDPAFPPSFPWFNTPRYWSDHILECKEQLSNLREPTITLITP